MPVYITEYSAAGRDGFDHIIPIPKEPNLAEQEITVSGASAQSAAFNAQTAFIMVHAEEAAHLKFGTNPTAVTTAHRIAAGETRFYDVEPGHKLAAIAG